MTAEEIVQRQFEAYNARDLERFLPLFAEDARLYRPPDPEPAVVGREALAEFYRTRRFNQPDLRAELIHRTTLGSTVMDHERIHGLGEEPVEMVMAYQVRDGLIQACYAFVAD